MKLHILSFYLEAENAQLKNELQEKTIKEEDVLSPKKLETETLKKEDEPLFNNKVEAKNEQGFSHGVGAISHPYFNPTPQTKAPQMMDPLAPFKKPLTPNMSAYLKDLIH